MSEQCAIAFNNAAVAGLTITGGAYQAGMPASNLLTRDLLETARTTSAAEASTQFVIDLGKMVRIGALALPKSNASRDAQQRWRTYTDAGLTDLVVDSGVVDCFGSGSVPFGWAPWGHPAAWDGKPSEEQLQASQRNLFWLPSNIQYARYVKFEQFDTGNADGFAEWGRLMVGDVWRPPYNMPYGSTIEPVDFTKVSRNDADHKRFETRGTDMRYAFVAQVMDEDDAMRSLEMKLQMKLHGEVFFVWNGESVAWQFRKNIFGQFGDMGALRYADWNNNEFPYVIEGSL